MAGLSSAHYALTPMSRLPVLRCLSILTSEHFRAVAGRIGEDFQTNGDPREIASHPGRTPG